MRGNGRGNLGNNNKNPASSPVSQLLGYCSVTPRNILYDPGMDPGPRSVRRIYGNSACARGGVETTITRASPSAKRQPRPDWGAFAVSPWRIDTSYFKCTTARTCILSRTPAARRARAHQRLGRPSAERPPPHAPFFVWDNRALSLFKTRAARRRRQRWEGTRRSCARAAAAPPPRAPPPRESCL